MARRGDRTTQKTVSAPKARRLARKLRVFTMKSTPGPHTKETSVPLGFAIRDLLGLARNSREAKYILRTGKARVDGKPRKDYRFPIGLFDILEFDGMEQKKRAVIDKKGRISFVDVPKNEFSKICRVESKRAAKGGKTMLSLSDGKTIILEKTGVKPGDSVKITVPENRIEEEFALKEGNTAMLIRGKHASETAQIKHIAPASMRKSKLITLEAGGREFQTTGRNVIVIGKEKAEIKLK